MSRTERIREDLRRMPGQLRSGWHLLAPRQRRRAVRAAIAAVLGFAFFSALTALGAPFAAWLCLLLFLTGLTVAAWQGMQALSLGARVPPSAEVRKHVRRQDGDPR